MTKVFLYVILNEKVLVVLYSNNVAGTTLVQ